ncbi:type II toxin-antitoxin system CcdA family antitoxin [Sphingomonas sp. So64.6b]|nr:type II toxin-antitoxin system CcdA family antitoxin [Sphingomonas sp. So64.6b]QNA86875.1 type II toxin-antitoxin system CcdA family antitoxin [Sphingomonas sp. So64.6b]
MPRSSLRETRTAFRRPTNVSLDSALIDEAKELGINISRACEQGLEKQVSEERARRWLEENRAALQASNEWVEKNGLPLEEFRLF